MVRSPCLFIGMMPWTAPQKKPPYGGFCLHWIELRGVDLNYRPSGYEPDELPDCSTPQAYISTPAGK